jgi:uncharacterized protein YunC (DUF1805 family)
MIRIETITVSGMSNQGVIIESPGGDGHPNMLVLPCRRGYLMCGYLNTEAAEKFGDAAVVVSGASFDDLLNNPVKAVSYAAYNLGIRKEMTGREAAELLSN